MKNVVFGILVLVGLLLAMPLSAAEGIPSITITSPNEGAFRAGHIFEASWTSIDLPPTGLMTGYLLPVGSVPGFVMDWPLGPRIVLFSASVENIGGTSGLYLPFTLPVGDYKFTLEVINPLTRNMIASDESVGVVSILPPNDVGASIKVITPNGGKTFIDGEPVQISWESVNAPVGSTVGISVRGSIDGALTWGYGIGSFTNRTNGTMTWTPRVFRQSGETYKIQAELFAPGAENWNSVILYSDSSDWAFTLNMPFGTTRSLVITAPTSTNILQAGRSYPITWQTTSISPDARILLEYKQFGTSTELSGTEIATVSNSGSYAWTVPANTSTSPAKWRIEAYYINEFGIYGAQGQSAYFTVTPPLTLKNFKFVGPNADMDEPHFQWEVHGVVKGAYYRIEHSPDLKQWQTFTHSPDFEAPAEDMVMGGVLVPPSDIQFFRVVEVSR